MLFQKLFKKQRRKINLELPVAPLPVRSYAVDAEQVYLYREDSTAIAALSAPLYRIFTLTEGCKTVRAHIADVSSKLDAEEADEYSSSYLEDALENLRELGLLVPLAHIVQTGTEEQEGTPRANAYPQIQTIAWITHHNPVALLRSIAGAAQNARTHERAFECQVYDDSGDTASEKATTARLRKLARQLTSSVTSIRYIGSAERREYIDMLCEHAGFSHDRRDLLSFALEGSSRTHYTNGANNNLRILGSAGRAVIAADDDIIFHFARNGGRSNTRRAGRGHEQQESGPEKEGENRVEFHSREKLLSARHFTGFTESLEHCRFEPIDFLREHERFLGRPLQDIVGELGTNRLELSRTDSPMLSTIMYDVREPVRLSLAGLAGDSGRPNGHMILSEPGLADLARSCSREEFTGLMKSRHIHRFTDEYVISRDSHFMSGYYAMDNRGTIPPFVPEGRGSDGAFRSVFSLMYRNGLVSYIPMEFIHAPINRRNTYDEDIESIHTRVTDFIARIIERIKHAAEPIILEPDERLNILGRELLQFSAYTDEELREYLRTVNSSFYARYIRELEESPALHTEPPAYLTEIFESHIRAVREYMVSDEIALPSDIDAPREERIGIFRQLLGSYGRLLIEWPVFHRAAREAAEEGIHPWRTLEVD